MKSHIARQRQRPAESPARVVNDLRRRIPRSPSLTHEASPCAPGNDNRRRRRARPLMRLITWRQTFLTRGVYGTPRTHLPGNTR